MFDSKIDTTKLCSEDFRNYFVLTQAIGNSSNAMENCGCFLEALLELAELDYAAIWMKGTYLPPSNQLHPHDHYYPFIELPAKSTTVKSISSTHNLLHEISHCAYAISSPAEDDNFDLFVHEYDKLQGSIGLCKLGEMGFIKLYRSEQKPGLKEHDIQLLLPAIEKFASILALILSHNLHKEPQIQDPGNASTLLKESLNQYKTVVANINEGLIVTDLEDRIVYANQQISAISGYHHDDLIGSIAHKIFTPESDWDKASEWIEHRLQGHSDTFTFKQIRPDGTKWWSLIHASPYRSSDGNIIGTIGVINDISEQKKSEKSIATSEAKIRAIINSALDAVVVINQKGEVTEWNSRAEMIFGWTQEEMEGLTLAETIIPSQFREAHHNGFHHYLKTGEGPALNQRLEISAMNRQGVEFPIELTIIPIKLEEEYFFSAFIRDITERKRAEEKRENLVKQLAQANSELKDFAYVVSHDLKAPLRAISSLAHWIADDYEDQFDEDGREQLNLLRGRVNRMSELITGILNYSRIGRVNTEIEKIHTHELVTEVVDLINSNDQLEIIISESLPTIQYNKLCFQQVIQNLVSNAIKYNDKPKGVVEIGYFKGMHQHTFWVKDNGPGISPKYHEKIFRIFQTLRPRDEVEATGVGLSIVKKIVNLFDGKIWLESELGEGSCFYFTIPHVPKLNLDI